jgi:hypothetical protein
MKKILLTLSLLLMGSVCALAFINTPVPVALTPVWTSTPVYAATVVATTCSNLYRIPQTGNLLIAVVGSNSLKEYNSAITPIITVGITSYNFSNQPEDQNGNIWLAPLTPGPIVAYNTSMTPVATKQLTPYVSGYSAIAFDYAGNGYFFNGGLHKVNASWTPVMTVTAIPTGVIAVDSSNNIYIAAQYGGSYPGVSKYNSSLTPIATATVGYQAARPQGLQIASDNTLMVSWVLSGTYYASFFTPANIYINDYFYSLIENGFIALDTANTLYGLYEVNGSNPYWILAKYNNAGTPTITPTVTQTVTQTITQTVTQTVTPTVTKTVTQTITQTITQTVTQIVTPTFTVTKTVTKTVTQTITQTVTQTVTPTVTQTITQTITQTVTPTVTQTITQTITQTVTPTVTKTATQTITQTVTQTITQTVTQTITQTITPTYTITPTPPTAPTPILTPPVIGNRLVGFRVITPTQTAVYMIGTPRFFWWYIKWVFYQLIKPAGYIIIPLYQ